MLFGQVFYVSVFMNTRVTVLSSDMNFLFHVFLLFGEPLPELSCLIMLLFVNKLPLILVLKRTLRLLEVSELLQLLRLFDYGDLLGFGVVEGLQVAHVTIQTHLSVTLFKFSVIGEYVLKLRLQNLLRVLFNQRKGIEQLVLYLPGFARLGLRVVGRCNGFGSTSVDRWL